MRSERVDDLHSDDDLSVVEVLGPQRGATQLGGAVHDHGIPERQIVVLAEERSSDDISWRGGVCGPTTEDAKSPTSRIGRQRLGDLPHGIHVELLEHLDAECASPKHWFTECFDR